MRVAIKNKCQNLSQYERHYFTAYVKTLYHLYYTFCIELPVINAIYCQET